MRSIFPARKMERKDGSERGVREMKKSLFLIVMMLVLPTLMIGCATTGQLEKVQAEQKMIDAKADQALKDAQAAKTAADAAKVKADETSARADTAIKAAEEREKAAAEKEKIADEKAKKAEAAFEKSMKK
jgi:murein lipoprotein